MSPSTWPTERDAPTRIVRPRHPTARYARDPDTGQLRNPIEMLCVMSTGDIGGGELAFLTQMDHSPRGLVVTAVVPSEGRLTNELRDRGITVTVLGAEGRPSLAQTALMVRCVGGQIGAERPQLIYAVGNKAAMLCAPASMLLRVPLIWCKQDLALSARHAYILSRCCRGVIAASDAASAGVEPGRLAVVYPPVRLPRDFTVRSPRPPATLSCVGRLEPTKGQRLLIKAAAALSLRFPDVEVLLAGREPRYAVGYTRELRRIAASEGLANRVKFIGWVDSIGELLERTTVYAQPSLGMGRVGREALGIAIAEASWAGLPVVASRAGGIPEAVRDGVTGTLVPEGDWGALERGIARYLADPEAAHAAGAAGQGFARERFDPHTVSSRWIEALDVFMRLPDVGRSATRS